MEAEQEADFSLLWWRKVSKLWLPQQNTRDDEKPASAADFYFSALEAKSYIKVPINGETNEDSLPGLYTVGHLLAKMTSGGRLYHEETNLKWIKVLLLCLTYPISIKAHFQLYSHTEG